MNEYKESLGRNIVDFLRDIGIDPFYGITILMLILVISYRSDIQQWEELRAWHKGIIISTTFGAVVFTIISILRLTGIMNI